MTGRPARSRPAARRRNWVIAAVVLAAAIASIAVFVVLRGPSPKSAADAYMAAMARGDYEGAYRELSETSKRSLREPGGLRQTAIGAAFSNGIANSYELGSVRTEAGKTLVEVALRKGNTETAVLITMAREDGRWRVEI